MNNRQKLIQEQFLNDEKAIIKQLNQVYSKSLTDINEKIKNLTFSIDKLQQQYDWMDSDDPKKNEVKSKIQSKIYQKQYQEQLQKQVSGIYDQLLTSGFVGVSDYLDKCYTDGFIGTIFDAHGQGVPFIMPIDQEAMIRAVQLESKISKGLYTKLGEDIGLLKKKITEQVSRSIATGMTYKQTAKVLENYTRIGYNNAIRIARTEGHRIQTTATMDAMEKAKEKGADVLKQWDATLDGRTRESHAQVDGEIRELNKSFSNGLDFPGDPSGGAAEVVNCRCALLQRARWALDDGFTKMNNFTGQIESFDSPQSYGEFKKAFFSKDNKSYMNYIKRMEDKYGTKDFASVLDSMSDREYKHYSKLLKNNPIYNKKRLKGLSAKISGEGIPEHDEPILIKTIDHTNKQELFDTLADYEKDAIMDDIETACVITRDGKVYKCFGVEDRVFPDFDLDDELYGAIVSHNHPISETTYSFSQDDFDLFQKYNIQLLRGCDEKYTYELSRNSTLVDDTPEDWANFENYYHAVMIINAKENGVGYRRWLNG